MDTNNILLAIISITNIRLFGNLLDLLIFSLQELGIYGCLNFIANLYIDTKKLRTLTNALNYKNTVKVNDNVQIVSLKLSIFAFGCVYKFIQTDYDVGGIFNDFLAQIAASVIIINAGKITDLEFLRPTLRFVFQPYMKFISGPKDERMVNFVNELQTNNLIDQEQIKKLNAILYSKNIDNLKVNDLAFLSDNINKMKELESVKNTEKLSEHIKKISEAQKKHLQHKNTPEILKTNLLDTYLNNTCTFYLRSGNDFTESEKIEMVKIINILDQVTVSKHLRKQDDYNLLLQTGYIRVLDKNDDIFPYKVNIYIDEDHKEILYKKYP